MAFAIGLLVTELAGRRLSLWQRVSSLIPEKEAKRDRAEKPVPTVTAKWWDLPSRRANAKRRNRAAAALSVPQASAPKAGSTAQTEPAREPAQPAIDVFQQAKDRARRRSK
jgi:hypothetical protein